MKLNQINEGLNHSITEGGEYGWKCWSNARYLDYSNSKANYEASVVYNTTSTEIYEATISDKDGSRPYRWVNPKFRESWLDEHKTRQIDPAVAWDDVTWTDVEDEDEFLDISAAMIADEQQTDNRETISLDLTDVDFIKLARLAHDRDITLNAMVNTILQLAIEKQDSGCSGCDDCSNCACEGEKE